MISITPNYFITYTSYITSHDSITGGKRDPLMRISLRLFLTAVILSLLAKSVSVPLASAELLDDVLTTPKTLIDRAIEARSGDDIYKDNEIVLKVNAVIAELGTIKASTKIY